MSPRPTSWAVGVKRPCAPQTAPAFWTPRLGDSARGWREGQTGSLQDARIAPGCVCSVAGVLGVPACFADSGGGGRLGRSAAAGRFSREMFHSLIWADSHAASHSLFLFHSLCFK